LPPQNPKTPQIYHFDHSNKINDKKESMASKVDLNQKERSDS
jgi:hypothetical protein